ncbi:glutamine synthetase [Sinosporangium siamense]|uniref:GS catalytic domain-containing protein n=1 Tax=Sinosporangium siamense TaxID=1367973 RepID=A0A919RKN6_9ACTN|nr:glutamine synthetase [Sinosporangium siamense]GII94992.1 hypothetical protein Ssi02_52230 [Sinosporangium siamense]
MRERRVRHSQAGRPFETPKAPARYGYRPAKAAMLPMSLPAALDAFEADGDLLEILGKQFTTAHLMYKRNELARFPTFVTDWEFREYAYHL